jgi:hypothetical protein
MNSKSIIDFLVSSSKEWIKSLHSQEACRKSQINSIFPSLKEIFRKIQNYCSEKQIDFFEMAPKFPKITEQPAKIVVHPSNEASLRLSNVSESSQTNKSKIATKKTATTISRAKWNTDEPDFPPLTVSNKIQTEKIELLDFNKNVLERSSKSTKDTNEQKDLKIKEESHLNTLSIQRTHSELAPKKSFQENRTDFTEPIASCIDAVKNEASLDVKAITTAGKHIELSDTQIINGLNHESNGASISKTANSDLRKTERKANCDPSDFHRNSKIKQKNTETPSKFTNQENVAEDAVKLSSAPDLMSTTEKTISLENSDIEEYIKTNHQCLTNLDIKILESMNKCYNKFERPSSRYNFVNTPESGEQQKWKQCQEFSNLIFSFLNENPLKATFQANIHRQSAPEFSEFRLFDQSYTLDIPRKSSP